MVQRYHELSNDYANATNSVIRVASLEKENQMINAQVESLTSKHVALQGTHKELEHSYEKLDESHAMLGIAHEVVITSVKSYQSSTHTCTCSQVEIMLSCDKPCCSQATNSCVEHVVADTYKDLINQKDDNSKKEVKELKSKPTKLKSKAQMQPSQYNHDHMVKKFEKGSNVTFFAPQQGQAKRKDLVQSQKSNLEHFTCSMNSKNKFKLPRREKYRARTRVCFICKEKDILLQHAPFSRMRWDLT